MTLAQLVIPTGMLALVSLLSAAFTGLAVFKLRLSWVKFSWHMWSAVAAVVFGITHALLAMFFY